MFSYRYFQDIFIRWLIWEVNLLAFFFNNYLCTLNIFILFYYIPSLYYISKLIFHWIFYYSSLFMFDNNCIFPRSPEKSINLLVNLYQTIYFLLFISNIMILDLFYFVKWLLFKTFISACLILSDFHVIIISSQIQANNQYELNNSWH